MYGLSLAFVVIVVAIAASISFYEIERSISKRRAKKEAARRLFAKRMPFDLTLGSESKGYVVAEILHDWQDNFSKEADTIVVTFERQDLYQKHFPSRDTLRSRG